jgi:hypothetical protein
MIYIYICTYNYIIHMYYMYICEHQVLQVPALLYTTMLLLLLVLLLVTAAVSCYCLLPHLTRDCLPPMSRSCNSCRVHSAVQKKTRPPTRACPEHASASS